MSLPAQLIVFGVTIALLTTVAVAQSVTSQVERLVLELDHESFLERSRAEKALTDLICADDTAADLIRNWPVEAGAPERNARLEALKKRLPFHLSFETVDGPLRGMVLAPGGLKGNAGRFDGKRTQITVPDLKLEAPFTLHFWFRTTTDRYAQILLSNYIPCSYAKEGISLVLYGSELKQEPRLGVVVGGKNHLDVRGAFADGDWHHVAIVGTEVTEVFVDGTSQTKIPLAYQASRLPMSVGHVRSQCGLQKEDHFKGDMDELVFVRRALTAEQIRKHVEALRPEKPGDK